MGGGDKLSADLNGKSVLRWSVEALADAGVGRIVIVTSPARIAEIAAEPWLPDAVVAVVVGGQRRQESVAAGVVALMEGAAPDGEDQTDGPAAERPDPVILIHDAARPLASSDLIRKVAEATARHGAAIPVLAVSETLKRLDGDLIAATVDRTNVVAAQTPQGVRLSLLQRAYARYQPDGPETWTDEASLLEACRIPVHTISGEASNLKVTVPADLQRARAMLDGGLVPGRPASAARPGLASTGRIGLGLDGHPFGPGDPLVLGGIRIEGAPRLAGHSDGDAALHAVADALLGAAGLGDLGRLFPADSRTPAGIDSRILLASVALKVREAGWQTANIDVTITASRPKLAGLLPAMEEAIAATIGVPVSGVNVKASTGNLDGPEGTGRSISATAIAWLVPLTAYDAADDAADDAAAQTTQGEA